MLPLASLGSLFGAAKNVPAAAPASGHVEGARIFGVTLIGATQHNLHKLVLTFAFIAIAWIAAWLLRQFLRLFIGTRSRSKA